MRPTGGVLGGIAAIGGSTEYQGAGTPHYHAEGHIVCAYQYGTMKEIEEKIHERKLTVDKWKQYNTWLHHEDTFDALQHQDFVPKVESAFFDRFRAPEHDGLSQVPTYLTEDARLQSSADTLSVSSALKPVERKALYKDGEVFLKQYKQDLQYVFSRVQHHVHKLTTKGYVPLNACRLKSKGKQKVRANDKCKANFPLTHMKTTKSIAVCRGVAKRFKLQVAGRRNAFGSMIGKRSCEWQSGTTPAFAVIFRSNTHTLPNYRIPIIPETHEDDMCHSKACRGAMQDPKEKNTWQRWHSERVASVALITAATPSNASQWGRSISRLQQKP